MTEGIRIDELDQTVLHSRDHAVPAMHDGLSVKLSVSQILSLLLREDLAEKLFAEDAAYDPGTPGPLASETVQAAIDEIAEHYISSRPQTLEPESQAQARVNIGAASPLRAVISGTANAISLADDGLLAEGRAVRFRAAGNNSGAATIAYNGGPAIACRTITGVALPAGYIRTDADTIAIYDGTYWVVDRQEERGSNANGEYLRLADGTQICRITETKSYTTNTATSGIHRDISTAGGWTFPAAFSEEPAVQFDLVGTAVWGGVDVRDAAGATQRVLFSIVPLTDISLQSFSTATGRWY